MRLVSIDRLGHKTLFLFDRGDPLAFAATELREMGGKQTNMKTPKPLRKLDQQGVAVREYEDDDKSVIAVDFGGRDDLTVDIVDDTAIVVVDGQQLEFELPPGANEVTTKGGILTIKG